VRCGESAGMSMADAAVAVGADRSSGREADLDGVEAVVGAAVVVAAGVGVEDSPEAEEVLEEAERGAVGEVWKRNNFCTRWMISRSRKR
ncbi:MAG: hypothetical protein ACXW3Z_15995, partial [Limisphaerales bacterium]